MKNKKIYIASPLFTPKEREENQEIDNLLKQAGYKTFLAQRDGILFADYVEKLRCRGHSNAKAEKIVLNLIGHIDLYQASEICDGTVFNLNGRVSDEGALIEAVLTFSQNKPVVLYKDDPRTLIHGYDNPLIYRLSSIIVRNIQEIVPELQRQEKLEISAFQQMRMTSKKILGEAGENPTLDTFVEIAEKYFF